MICLLILNVGRLCCYMAECCAIIYCWTKLTRCCAAIKNDIKSSCESMTDVCCDDHNNKQVETDVKLAGIEHDNAEAHV